MPPINPINPITGMGGQTRKPQSLDNALALLPMLTGGGPEPIQTSVGFLFGPEERALQHKIQTDAADYNRRQSEALIGLAAMAEEGRRRREQAAAARGLTGGLGLSPAIGDAAATDPQLARSIGTEAAKRGLPPAFGSLHAAEKWARGQGLQPGTPEYVQAVRAYPVLRADRSTTNVSVGGPATKGFDTQMGKLIADRLNAPFETAQTDAAAAGTALPALQRISTLVESGPETDKLSDFRVFALEAANALGFGDDISKTEIANAQQYRQATQELVVRMAKMLPGQFSDREAKLMADTVARYTDQREAKREIIRYMTAKIASAADTARYANELSTSAIDPETGVVQPRLLVPAQRKLDAYKAIPLIGSVSSASGERRIVYWTDFKRDFLAANPTLTAEDAARVWKAKYAGR